MRVIGDVIAFAFWLAVFVGVMATLGAPDLPEHLYRWLLS